jgi:protein SCO1/2
MSPNALRLLTVVAAFVVGLGVFSAAIFFVAGRAPWSATAPSAIGGAFRLTDQDGRPVTEAALKGKPSLVFFGFTHCPDVCPTTLFDVSELYKALGPDADRLGAYFVSVDPERDTPAVLKEYLSSFDPHLRGLTGDADSIAAIQKAYRVYAKKVPLESGDYTMDHTAIVYLMDKDGRFVAPFSLKRKPEDAAVDIRRYF